MADPKENYRLHIARAREMLDVARENLADGYFGSACNRAYYAVFYAASALVYSKGMSFGKHSAVIAAFRQYFVKTGEFEKKWSDIYEFVMTSRNAGDYDLTVQISREQGSEVVSNAQGFVEEVEQWLRKHNLL